MATYQKQDFKDEIKDSDGNITQVGTTVKKEHLEHIEDGIVMALNEAEEAKKAAENAGSIDLSGYYTKEEINQAIHNYYTKTEVDQMFGTYVDEIAALVGGDV